MAKEVVRQSLWHSPSEQPKKGRNIIVLTRNGRIIDNREKVEISMLAWLKWVHAAKWCYLKDLVES